MIKVIHKRDECIGCAACVALHPDGWEMADDGKSNLIGGIETSPDTFEKTLTDEKDIELHKEAADSCPVSIIRTE